MTSVPNRDRLVRELMELRNRFEDICSRNFSSPFGERRGGEGRLFRPAAESYIDEISGKYHLRIALPGIDPAEVQIQVQGNSLSVTGEHKVAHSDGQVKYQYRELPYGRFARTIKLPEGVDSYSFSTEYRNGVLEMTAPIEGAGLPRHIELKTAPVSAPATA
jgi:HSP20 family protein